MNSFQELVTFRLYRTLTGRVESVDVFRRNGKTAVRFIESPESSPGQGVSAKVWSIVAENLTLTEQRRWWKLLGGRSIEAIAAEEGVSRTAIYTTIRGKDGRGGMIAKNRWVQAWWLRRQTPEDL